MTLSSGDLTTVQRVCAWLASAPSLPSAILNQEISAMSGMIYGELNRVRLYSRTIVRTFNGTGNKSLLLPDYPVTGISQVQIGNSLINPCLLPVPGGNGNNLTGYGYRFIPWDGNLPGQPSMLEMVNGVWWRGSQNVQVTYQAGYLISNEEQVIPGTPGPYTVQVNQPLGICSKDNGVSYVGSGLSLTPVLGTPSVGQYNPPVDTIPGLYTFSSADKGLAVNINYSFIPSPLEEACIQMIVERYSYRSRVGEISKSLGGQETIRFMRQGIPPEVLRIIRPYVSVIMPSMGTSL